MLTQKQILKNIQHNTSKGGGGDTPTPTPTPEVFTGFDVFITGEAPDFVINYTAQELAENIVKCAKHHGNAIIYANPAGTSTFCATNIDDIHGELRIAFTGMNGETLACSYFWIDQMALVGVRVERTQILDEEVQITSEMQEYFNYILTNLGINR